ncbi:Zinc finger BED domain-containing protein 1 [Merluccius polli]|uniref:Zinc finger BED domain-containing protein 1 n=1 Tax=Merluccius polli TaxID=89951 RepID=A0AA47MJG1_MERPO|nr:Zinc finger BED domain-containing protein 1 [Merluccius polli]
MRSVPHDSTVIKDLKTAVYNNLNSSLHAKRSHGTTENSEKTEKAQEEVNRYREVTPVPLSENPLTWWRVHARYPLLARQAKRYLCIPGTSVPSERVFSTAGDIVTAQRSCLTPQHVNQLLFLQKNLSVSKK